MKKIIYLLFFILFCAYICYADDPVLSTTNGSFIHGESVTLSGSNFGTNALDFEWTRDDIENGTPGTDFSKTNWYVGTDTGPNNPPEYSTAQAHSGSQSILCDHYGTLDPGEGYDSILRFDAGVETEIFIKGWVYHEKNDDSTSFQWKHLYWHSRTSISVYSGWRSALRRVTATGWENNFTLETNLGETRTVVDQPHSEAYNPLGTWICVELWIKKSSSAGTADGEFLWHRVGQPSYDKSSSTLVTHETTDEDFRYVWINIYYGNLSGGSDPNRDMNIYWDDIYISDTRARVEIGDAATWGTCTHREVQIPTAWATDEITFDVNTGTFGDGQAYLYVVNSSGEVNTNGFLITIGSEGGGSSPTLSTGGTGTTTVMGTGTSTVMGSN